MERLTLLQQIIGSLSCMGLCLIAHVAIANTRQIIRDLGYEPKPESEAAAADAETSLDGLGSFIDA